MAAILLVHSATAFLLSAGLSYGPAYNARLCRVRMDSPSATPLTDPHAWATEQDAHHHDKSRGRTSQKKQRTSSFGSPVATPLSWATDEDSRLRFGSDAPKQPPIARYASTSGPKKKRTPTASHEEEPTVSARPPNNLLGWATDDDNALRFGSDAPKQPPPPRYANGQWRQMRTTSRADGKPAAASTNSLGWATDESNVAVKNMMGRHVHSAPKASSLRGKRAASANQAASVNSANSLSWATGHDGERLGGDDRPPQHPTEHHLPAVDCTQAARAARKLLQGEASEVAAAPPAEATTCEPRAAKARAATSADRNGLDETDEQEHPAASAYTAEHHGSYTQESARGENEAFEELSAEALGLLKKRYGAYLAASAARLKAEKALTTAQQALAIAIKAEDRAGKNADEALRAVSADEALRAVQRLPREGVGSGARLA